MVGVRSSFLWVLMGLLASPAMAGPVVKLRFQVDSAKPKYTPLVMQYHFAGDGVDLRVADGGMITAPAQGGKLKIDSRGDGKVDKTLADGDIARVMVHTEAGSKIPYALRMVKDVYNRPCLVPACAMTARIGGLKIAIIDTSLNGKYNDYGSDSIVVGNTPYAYPLSNFLVVGSKAFEMKVAEDGSSLELTPSDEKLGRLDFTSKFSGDKKPLMVVFRRAKGWGNQFVALYGSQKSYLPIDEWQFAFAVFTEDLWAVGDEEITPVKIAPGDTLFEWGPPYKLLIAPTVEAKGMVRSITPAGVWKAPQLIEKEVDGPFVKVTMPRFVGRSGEAYVGNWRKADTFGYALADPSLSSMRVRITKDGATVNADMLIWKPMDMSGLVKKARPFWTPYEWKTKTKGKVKVRVEASSGKFGGKLTSNEVELEID